MTIMTIDLPDAMKLWVEREATASGHDDPGEIVRDLIRREQERRAEIAALQRLVDEGRASGVDSRSREQIMSDIRRRARSRLVDHAR